jgi:hypothetical protein
MIIGTNHFVSLRHAKRYYREQFKCDVDEIVAHKIETGEIKIGRPSVKPGDRIVLTDKRTRYAIIEGD